MTAIDLPSNDGASGLADDAAAIRSALDEIGAPTVVVGHSYGGIAVSEGAAGAPNAVGLVYLAAFMLDAGESLLDAMQHQLADWIELDEAAGRHLAQRSEEVLYGDCAPQVAADAKARLSWQSVAAHRDAADASRLAEPAEHVPDLRARTARCPRPCRRRCPPARKPCAASRPRTRRSSRVPTTSADVVLQALS